MKKNIGKILLSCLSIVLILTLAFVAFKDKKAKKLEIKDYKIEHELKFGGVYIQMTIEDFNQLGFEFGDSVDVIFSNGYELKDLPYYNGYYVDMNEPLLIGYPGYEYIKVAVNYGEDLWITAKLDEKDTATIKINKKGKYLDIQNSRDIHYAEEQGDIPNVIFANFRNVKVGNIKEDILYRAASPVDNSHHRAPIVDKLISEVNVNYIVNLSDGDEDLVNHINKNDFNSPYFLSLYNENKVIALSMNMQFEEQSFKDSLVKGLTAMANNPGPYLVHCVEGKDRTGYVIMVIESLMEASYEEMVDDYMLTYDNYYGIDKNDSRYKTIKEKNIDLMLHYIIGDEKQKKDLSKIDDYSEYTKKYLISIGMNEEDINKLVEQLK